jgi:DNA-directed RNA polymerase subunit RPC12/RpoP
MSVLDGPTKVCVTCQKAQPLFLFYWRTGRKTRGAVCKACRKIYEQERYRYDDGKIVAHARHRRYGVTPQELVEMFKRQVYKCACCSDPLPEITKHVHIDHDHTTGKVRGIVCRDCNMTLAYGRDDPSRLRAAADFLERHAAQEERGNAS